jgi:hypothetical protein
VIPVAFATLLGALVGSFIGLAAGRGPEGNAVEKSPINVSAELP